MTINRDAAVAPVVMYQTFMSIVFRLEVNNYDDPRIALATCLLQSVLEIVLRLTAPERDAWAKRVWSRFCCASRWRRGARTILVVASIAPDLHGRSPREIGKSFSATTTALRGPDSTLERVAAAHERHAVVTQFHVRMVLADMWAEYAGIYIGSVVLFLGQRNVLYYPFRPFRKHRVLLDGGNFNGELAIGTMVMVVIEIITDTVCILFTRRGSELLTVWRELPAAALAPIVFSALMFATLAGQARSLYGDTVDHCNHRDVCWCVGNGLLPGGVREGYCMLLYPNSSGRPTT